MHMPADLKQALHSSGAQIVLGPRSGARDIDMCMPIPLAPAFPDLDASVTRVESLRPDTPLPLTGGGHAINYREYLETSLDALETTNDGQAIAVQHGKTTFLAAWLDQAALQRVLNGCCTSIGIETQEMPQGVRRRDTQTERFWFNYDTNEHRVGDLTLAPTSVTRQTTQN